MDFTLKSFKIYLNPEEDSCKEIILGIDEVGRGPVLGPMVYCGFFCSSDIHDELKERIKVNDSKKLTESARELKFKLLTELDKPFGFIANIITPIHISTCMLRDQKYNLNEISHESAIDIIRHVTSYKYNLKKVYMDALGPVGTYTNKVKKLFPGINVKIAEKADAIYPVVSAASIIAKVLRDRIIKIWESNDKLKLPFGCGYPSDELTKKYLQKSVDSVFGFPPHIRSSWAPAAAYLSKSALVDWKLENTSTNPNPLTVTPNLDDIIQPF